MKKIFIIICLTSFTVFAQIKTKKIEILSTSAGEIVNAQITIEEGKQNLTSIQFLGRDHQYQQITEYLGLFYGSPKDFYIFMNKLKDAFNEETDVTQTIDECSVTTKKMMGKKVITISPQKKSGYRLFNLKTIEKIIDKFQVWAVENKVDYK